MLMAMLMIIIIMFNITNSQVMFYDTLQIDQAANIMLGDTVLSVVQTYRYLGHTITNNMADETDMEDKMEAQWLSGRMPDSRSREHCHESPTHWRR